MITWRCQICEEERPDEKISVLTYPMKNLSDVEINTKYCNDKPECYQGALKKKEEGKL